MNALSWSIYIIYFIGNLHPLLVSIGVIFGLANVALFLYHACNLDDTDYKGSEYIKHNKDKRLAAGKRLIIGIPIFIAIAAIVPDKQTAVLIAASQVGEKLITNENVTSVVDPSVDLLRTWIQNELKEQKTKLGTTAKDAAKTVTDAAKAKVTEEIAKKLHDAAK